jgi:hypothetical protein
MIQTQKLSILLAFLCTTSLLAHAQNLKSRTVERTEFDGPVEIVSLEIEGQPGQINDQIIAGKDWLKTLNLNFKNTHDKSIVYMEVELEIAPTGKMDLPLRLPIRFGKRPGASKDTQESKTLNKLAPNKTKKLSLSDEMSIFLSNYMREKEIEDIDKVKVYVEFIVFEDGIGWSKGHILRQDTKNPNKWLVDGIWIKRRISYLKNRYGGPRSGPTSN